MQAKTINVFLSYTRREAEVRRLQPITDAYCDLLLKWAQSRGVNVFYDRSSIPQDVEYSGERLAAILRSAVLRSHLLVSFLSPEYIGSRWCRFEYDTKLRDSPRQIHRVYWKPEIASPLFPRLAMLYSPGRTRFLIASLEWDRIRSGDRGSWRDTRFNAWMSNDDPESPCDFTDVTDVYDRGFWAGFSPVARCAQKSAEILCREHPALFGGQFDDQEFFADVRH